MKYIFLQITFLMAILALSSSTSFAATDAKETTASNNSAASDKVLPYFTANDMTPYWGVALKNQMPAEVTSFKAINQNAEPVTEKSFEKQVSLVNFFFADCPSFCPTMMMSIREFQNKFKSSTHNVKFYSFSVKPDRDNPEKLKLYAKNHKIDLSYWSLLTGEKEQIFKVGKDMFKADGSVGEQKKPDSFIHTKNIYLVDQQRRIRGIYDTGNPEAMAFLASDIEKLKSER